MQPFPVHVVSYAWHYFDTSDEKLQDHNSISYLSHVTRARLGNSHIWRTLARGYCVFVAALESMMYCLRRPCNIVVIVVIAEKLDESRRS